MHLLFKLRGIIIFTIAVTCLIGFGILVAAPPAMPVISRNCPVFVSAGVASGANDSNYGTTWRGAVPGWIAYDLSDVPAAERSQVIVVWYNPDTYDYDFTVKNNWAYGIVKSYIIEGNSAAGSNSAPTSGWVTLAAVTGNNYHSRQHFINLAGYNWVRLNISEANGSSDTSGVSINLDIHNAGRGAEDDWIFYGDSITAGGMVANGDNSFAQLVNKAKPNYFPVAECGGIGGIFSIQGAQYIEQWLSVFPGKYVGISFGTNDAWGNQTGATNFGKNLETMVKAVLTAGKIPVIPTIPWSSLTAINSYVPDYNRQIIALYEAYPEIVPGPDLWSFFHNNPGYLSSDGVHPNTEGYAALRQIWADTMLATVYSGTATTSPFVSSSINSTATITPTPTLSPVVTASPTATGTASLAPSAAPTSSSSAQYTVTYAQNDWGDGATVTITIKNNSPAAIDGWSLEWTFPGGQKIVNMWCGSYTQNGTAVTVQNMSYNGVIPAGGAVNFGFNISYGGANAKPTGFILNGTTCEVEW
ncbi:MAG: cellulose binding domain-containing protein [Bacillota bacterium]